MSITGHRNQREYELISASHDAISAHHDRGFEDSDSFSGQVFSETPTTLAVLEIDKTVSPPVRRALISPDAPDEFSLEMH